MSFSRMLDRVVDLELRGVSGRDARGNEIRSETVTFEGVLAARDLIAASENVVGADQQARTFRYFFGPEVVDEAGDRIALELSGYDRIHDDDETFEIRGEPETFTKRRRGKVHHLEPIAYLIEGL